MATVNDVDRAVLDSGKETWLVTGAAGFIGSHLTAKLTSLGKKVIAVDNMIAYSPNSERYFYDLLKANPNLIEFYAIDVRSLEMEKLIAKSDVVLHQAGLNGVPISFKKPSSYFDNNVVGFLNIIGFLESQAFVWASSSAAKQAISPYGLSKKNLESLQEMLGVKGCGLRYHNVFGPYQNANKTAIAGFIEKARADNPIEIFGECWRDFTYVANVVDANLAAAVSGACGVYDIGMSQPVAVVDAAKKIVSISNSKSAIIQTKGRHGDIKESCADITDATKAFKYSPKVSFEEGLKIMMTKNDQN